MGKFVIKVTEKGSFRFNLKAGNGEIIATSQLYKALKSCNGGILSVQNNAPIAEIEDQTVENGEKIKHPKFQVYLDKAGEFRFRLTAKNGQIIATSEGYKKIESCKKGIASVKKNVVEAKIVMEGEK